MIPISVSPAPARCLTPSTPSKIPLCGTGIIITPTQPLSRSTSPPANQRVHAPKTLRATFCSAPKPQRPRAQSADRPRRNFQHPRPPFIHTKLRVHRPVTKPSARTLRSAHSSIAACVSADKPRRRHVNRLLEIRPFERIGLVENRQHAQSPTSSNPSIATSAPGMYSSTSTHPVPARAAPGSRAIPAAARIRAPPRQIPPHRSRESLPGSPQAHIGFSTHGNCTRASTSAKSSDAPRTKKTPARERPPHEALRAAAICFGTFPPLPADSPQSRAPRPRTPPPVGRSPSAMIASIGFSPPRRRRKLSRSLSPPLAASRNCSGIACRPTDHPVVATVRAKRFPRRASPPPPQIRASGIPACSPVSARVSSVFRWSVLCYFVIEVVSIQLHSKFVIQRHQTNASACRLLLASTMGTNWSPVGSAQQYQGSFKYGTAARDASTGNALRSCTPPAAASAASSIRSKICARLLLIFSPACTIPCNCSHNSSTRASESSTGTPAQLRQTRPHLAEFLELQ